jgi:hypothetical protein
MSKDDLRHLRSARAGSRALGWLAGRGADEPDRTHLHWDRRNRRWVTHEDAGLSTPASSGSATHLEQPYR